MAITTTEQQYTWSAANSQSINAATNATSDIITHTANTVFQSKVQIKADNNGTPAAGDTVDFYLLESLGDPDGAVTDEFATTTHGKFLGRLDTTVSDPVEMVVDVPGPFYKSRIYAINNSAGRAITVSAIMLEQNG